MTPQNALDAAALIAAAGGALFVLVNIFRMAMPDLTPRATITVALVGGLVLVVAYALSNNLIAVANLFNLIVAWIAVVATGAGLNSTANAARTNTSGG
jgi:hypothetical protein